MSEPKLTWLESGYWHIRWTSEIWAQGHGSSVLPGHFFHAESTYTPERGRQAQQLLDLRRTPE